MFIQILHTVFIISIGTHYLLTIIALKFELVHYITYRCVGDIAVCKASNVDPDRTPPSAASDLGLHCLQMFICPNLRPVCPNNSKHFQTLDRMKYL